MASCSQRWPGDQALGQTQTEIASGRLSANHCPPFWVGASGEGGDISVHQPHRPPCVCSGGGGESLLRGTLFLGAWENPPYRTVTCPCGFSPGGLVLGGTQLPDSATPCQLLKYRDLSVLRDKQPRPPNAWLSEYPQPSNAKVNGRWGRGALGPCSIQPASFPIGLWG